jgi:hypothetical protein
MFASVASKADPSVAQNRRDLRMTPLRVFQQPAFFSTLRAIFAAGKNLASTLVRA